MPQLPSLPQAAHLGDLLARFPKNIAPLLTYVNAVLRSEGELSIAQRELIAAYVSGLNACNFCHGSHAIYAQAFGIEPSLIGELLDDVETSAVSEPMKALLAYVKKLNTLPNKLVQADMDAVLAQGWSEDALFEAIEVTGLFNMMNRIVEGGGVTFSYADGSNGEELLQQANETKEDTYLKFLTRIQGKGSA